MTGNMNTPKGGSIVNGIRTALGLGGVASLIMGILILVWPGQSVIAVTIMVAIYAAIAGLANFGVGVFTKNVGGWQRAGYIALGVVFLLGAVIALVNIQLATAGLMVFVAIMVGIIWIIEGVVAFSMLGQATSKGWTVFYGILSIIAGIILVVSPLVGATTLWLLLGVGLVVLGIVQIARGFTFGNR
ncbi:MAG: HdeD family acid-resistance protein [Propioniciclava sp.]